MNIKGRSERIERGLRPEYPNTSDDELLIDALTDLMHFADDHEIRFSDSLRIACGHYLAEIAAEPIEKQNLIG